MVNGKFFRFFNVFESRLLISPRLLLLIRFFNVFESSLLISPRLHFFSIFPFFCCIIV